MATLYGFGPDVVANMTPDQQLMYLEGDGPGDDQPAGYRRFANAAEAQAYLKSRKTNAKP